MATKVETTTATAISAADRKPGPSKRRVKVAYHRRDLPTALIEIALDLIVARDGPHFSLREIAGLLGVQHPSVYRHFRDKDALLQQIAAHGFRRLHEVQIARLIGVTDCYARLMENGRGHIQFCEENPGLFKLMFNYGNPAIQTAKEVITARDATAALLLDLIVACQARQMFVDISAETIRAALWSTAHGLAHLLMTGGIEQLGALPLPRDAFIDRVLAAPLEGLLRR